MVSPQGSDSCLFLFLTDYLPFKQSSHGFPGLPHQVEGNYDPETIEEDEVNPEMKEVVCGQSFTTRQPLRAKCHPTYKTTYNVHVHIARPTISQTNNSLINKTTLTAY